MIHVTNILKIAVSYSVWANVFVISDWWDELVMQFLFLYGCIFSLVLNSSVGCTVHGNQCFCFDDNSDIKTRFIVINVRKLAPNQTSISVQGAETSSSQRTKIAKAKQKSADVTRTVLYKKFVFLKALCALVLLGNSFAKELNF